MKQQVSRILRFGALALAVALPGGSAPPPSSEIWITLGQEEADRVLPALALAARAPVLQIESEGDIVVARIREDRLPLLSRIIHERLHRCGGFVAHESREAAFEAVTQELSLAPLEPLVAYTIDNGPVVETLLSGIQETNVRGTIEALAAFYTRYHTTQTGKDSAAWIRDLWAGYAQGRPDVTVELLSHPSSTTPQPSVILTIQGTTLPGEVVVLGAHQDSINFGPWGRAPGADDDASGVASLSEVIRVAMANGYRPQRTVKFMAYAAEEVGLRGSAAIAAQHRSANVNVVGVLQLDMTNYKGTPSVDIAMITDHTNAAQNAFLEQLVDVYLGLPRTTTQCGYACSDHASWNSRGYVASFPFESTLNDSNPRIHSSGDTLALSGNNAHHAVKFAKLSAAYLAELAKGGLDDDGNLPPTANAGTDQTVVAGTAATLNGSGSDPDSGPGPLSFAWSQVSGPATVIDNPAQAVASVTPATAGVYVFRLTVSDGSATASDDVTLTASSPAGTAEYDATLRAPRCGLVASWCDSGASLLLGRGTRGPEPNQPNTIASSCSDGSSGSFHADESNDRIVVATLDGTPLAPGKTVKIEATVWAWTTPSADHLDLYYTANAASPAWTFITTLTPSAAGAQTLSATYTLPAGGLQAVRARFRYQGSVAACGAGSYNDHDDLAFAVQ